MLSRRLLMVSVLAVLPLAGALTYRLHAETPAAATATGLTQVDNAVLQNEVKKAQIQSTLSLNVAALRQKKFDLLKAQAGTAPEVITEASVNLEQAQTAIQVANLNLDILQVQAKDAAATPVAPAAPKVTLDPIELKISTDELHKAQIQTESLVRISLLRNQLVNTLEAQVKAGQGSEAKLIDAKIDALVAQASADSAKLDLESFQKRMTTVK